MVTNRKQHSSKNGSRQASRETLPSPNEIKASTPYDFAAKNLTALRRAASGGHHAREDRLSIDR